MGSTCSVCTQPQVPQSIEENIFDILTRDLNAPDDLFKPLDVHFARNHTLSNLLALYPSVSRHRRVVMQLARRLPAPLVATIWKHYFEYFLIDPTTPWQPATPHSPGGGGLAYHASSSKDANGGVDEKGRMLERTNSFGTSSRSVQHQQTPRSPGGGQDEEQAAEIACMQWFVTDVLRHDLACLKERYDEVLAASLAMPQQSQQNEGAGFVFNPVPVLKAIRGELQRLNNMPIDYLARVLLKEMKGVSEEDELSLTRPGPPGAGGGGMHGHARKSSYSTARMNVPLSPPNATGAGLGSPSSPNGTSSTPAADAAGASSSAGGGGNPLDKNVGASYSPAPSSPPSHREHLGLAPPSARQLPNLTLDRFAAHIDFAMKNLFDRYYRKGYWVLFSLNLVHNARKVQSKFVSAQQTRTAAGGGGAWSDRIANAALAATRETPATIQIRKTSVSASASIAPPSRAGSNRTDALDSGRLMNGEPPRHPLTASSHATTSSTSSSFAHSTPNKTPIIVTPPGATLPSYASSSTPLRLSPPFGPTTHPHRSSLSRSGALAPLLESNSSLSIGTSQPVVEEKQESMPIARPPSSGPAARKSPTVPLVLNVPQSVTNTNSGMDSTSVPSASTASSTSSANPHSILAIPLPPLGQSNKLPPLATKSTPAAPNASPTASPTHAKDLSSGVASITVASPRKLAPLGSGRGGPKIHRMPQNQP